MNEMHLRSGCGEFFMRELGERFGMLKIENKIIINLKSIFYKFSTCK
jgi:hypothetical protein